MGRANDLIMNAKAVIADEVDGEVEELNARPDDIPEDVWKLIQENGRLATERLNEILVSPKFIRLRASDQAKLIALAQNRAYGMPKQNRVDPKKPGMLTDATAHTLRALDNRSRLPEYRKLLSVDDAEVVNTNDT